MSFCTPVSLDEGVGRAIMGKSWLGGALQFRNDAVRQRLAQLNPPLVERVDIPDGALDKDFVFVECDRSRLPSALRL
jgi:hypothetical protein